jgi:hypothetical protein
MVDLWLLLGEWTENDMILLHKPGEWRSRRDSNLCPPVLK